MLDTLAQEIRFAARSLRRSPAFTLGVAVTLGLGIGANAAVFGILDRMLFRPPPRLIDPSFVHRIYAGWQVRGKERLGGVGAFARYNDLRTKTTSFVETAAFAEDEFAVGVGDAAREMRIAGVSASFFNFFDAPPRIGRYFAASEDTPPSGEPVAVMSDATWRVQFAERADVVGSKVQIDRVVYTVIGVAAPDFVGLWPSQPPAYFVPISSMGASQSASLTLRTRWWATYQWDWLGMIARRARGASLAEATRDVNAAMQASYANQRIESPRAAPANVAKPRALVASILTERGPTESMMARVFTWVAGVALLVLLIACANVGNLLLSHTISGRRDVALRLALGASAGRVLARVVIETTLLAVVGGAVALGVGEIGNAILREQFLPGSQAADALYDPRTLVFVATVVLAVGLGSSIVPMFESRRLDLNADLAHRGRSGVRGAALRRVLLVVQVALSVVLLVGAGVFIKSVSNVVTTRLGYDPARLAIVELNLRGASLDSAQLSQLRASLLARALSMPAVENASLAITVPFWSSRSTRLFVDGIENTDKLGRFDLNAVSPSYFATMGTRLARGRGFSSDDDARAQRVMVVSLSMANALWPQRDPIGQCVRLSADTMPCTYVVGVAEDIKASAMSGDPGLFYYLPAAQMRPSVGGLFIRVRGDASRMTETLRRELQREMPTPAYVSVSPFADVISRQTRSWVLGSSLFSAFGVLALIVASIGVYSVVSHAAAQRRHELAVRSALGATGFDVVRLFVGETMRVTAAGVLIGSVVALAVSREVQPLLFEESARDPVVFAVVGAVLVAAGLTASWIPSRRAAVVNPLDALRSE